MTIEALRGSNVRHPDHVKTNRMKPITEIREPCGTPDKSTIVTERQLS